MTFRLLIDETRRAVESALENLGYPAQRFDVSEPPRKEFGDLTCNVAFQLGRRLQKKPSEIAGEIIEKQLKPYIKNNDSLILAVELHPAGYINFRADFAKLSAITLNKVLQNPKEYGHYDARNGKHVIIEHTSVNPNKALHVGHMRNVILGDTLYRILESTNHKTTVLNYVDDSGLQVADIVVGFKFAGFPVESGKKFDQYCGDEVYVKINEMYEKDPALAEKRKVVLQEIEQGTSELAKFASEITMRVLNEQLKTCWRMKARYDLLNFESHIVGSKLWAESFELLKKAGIVTLENEGKNKGCWVIKGENDDDKVVVRSDGTATYIAKDIPYAAWKLGLVEDPFSYHRFAKQWDGSDLWAAALGSGDKDHPQFNSADQVITIIDSRQARLQKIVSQVLSQMQKEAAGYHHLGYEAVTLSSDTAKALGLDIGDRQFMHMSGRKGIYVNADYVLDQLHAKAYEEVKSRNPVMGEGTLNEIAEEVAVSAIRYSMVKQDLDKIITFDIKESLSLEGDTGPYLQYAHARSQRILEKSGQEVHKPKFEKLAAEPEQDLVKLISSFDLVVEEAAETLSPKSLARYAYSLATSFNLFYEKVPVIKEQDKEVMMARLGLVKAFGITLKNALEMLGVTALEKM